MRESGSRLCVTTRRAPEVRNGNDRADGVQTNTCPMCGKVFSKTYGRRRHVFSHTGERPHGWLACDSKFVRKEYLRLHWRRHTGEKPYGCHLCPNDFARKDTLARHIRSFHERAKPHRCADYGLSAQCRTDFVQDTEQDSGQPGLEETSTRELFTKS
ncbi:hypothetical protein HPB52_002558 [Rhipicephalus sanguineus]|uniref:C2H2-type domain-containing protein n=1 Tax=Rhipicephalus sanguineus TaxID=34632 RepID=A0A9D4SMT7_RHISA|nr:hypothetical protein HPB52_002558 [Rhipicephalus sanguineus]